MNIVERMIMDERLRRGIQRGKYREYLIDFYEENQSCELEYLEEWGFKDKKSLPYVSTRLVKRVVDTLSMVYKRPPTRYLADNKGNALEKDGVQDFVAKFPQFNLQLKQCERYYNLLKNVLFRFAYDPENDEMFFYVETDYIPEFGPYNNIYPIGYHIPLPQDTDTKETQPQEYIYISDTELYVHDGETDEKRPAPGMTELINPYGIMPIIDFSEQCAGTYWNLGARSLVDTARHFNIGMLNTAYAHHFQAFDQPVVTGMRAENLPIDSRGNRVLKTGSDEAWLLDDGGTASLLGFNPKLVESIEFYRGWLNMELSNYGLQATFKESGNPMSGFAIKVSSMELLEKRESDIDVFSSKEQRIYAILKAMNKYHAWGFTMPDNARMMTDFVEPDFPIEPAEERSQAEWEWLNNLSTREDWLRAKNPDLTEDMAAKQIEENALKNRQTRGLFPAADNNEPVEQNT